MTARDSLVGDKDFNRYAKRVEDLMDQNYSMWDFDPEEILEQRKNRRTREKQRISVAEVPEQPVDVNEASDEEDSERLVPAYMRSFEKEHAVASDDEDDKDDSNAPAVLSKETLPGYQEALPCIFIKNLVITCMTDCRINFDWVMQRAQQYGFSRNERRFVALMFRCSNPRTSTLAFENGKFVNTGSQQVEDAKLSIMKMIEIIESLTDDQGHRPYKNIKVLEFRVCNVVGSTKVPFKINLNLFCEYSFVRYVPDLFVGAIVRVCELSKLPRNQHVKALVFASGNVVIMGAKTREHIGEVYQLLYPHIARSSVQHTLTASAQTSESQRRRNRADKRKLAKLSDKAQSVIPIDQGYQLDEFRRVNENRVSGAALLEMKRQQGRGSLAQIGQHTRNILAIRSMQQADIERSAAQQQQQQQQPGEQARIAPVPTGDAKRTRLIGTEEARQLAMNHDS